MREIIYRGKDKENGEWRYGLPYAPKDIKEAFIIVKIEMRTNKSHSIYQNYEVIPETIGKLVVLPQQIYEADICEQNIYGDKIIGVVEYDPEAAAYGLKNSDGFWQIDKNNIKILGNKFDNPELLQKIL